MSCQEKWKCSPIAASHFFAVIKATGVIAAVRKDKPLGAVGLDKVNPVCADAVEVRDTRCAMNRMNEAKVHSEHEGECNYTRGNDEKARCNELYRGYIIC